MTETLWLRMKATADDLGTTVSELMRRGIPLVEEYIVEHKRLPPPKS